MDTPRLSLVFGSILVGAAATTACVSGGLDTQEVIARGPAGIQVSVELAEGRLVGELLQVRPEGLLILVRPEATVVPWEEEVLLVNGGEIGRRRLRAGSDWPVGDEEGREVRWDRATDREWLAGLARFPNGMAADVERRLLELHGQTAVARYPRPDARPHDDGAAFLAAVRGAAHLYAEPTTAVRHGYRKVGPDFPGMGEHWVNTGRILSGGVDPARPQILTYVDVEGEPRLTGMAFAVPLSAHEDVPAAPVPSSAWHDHGGSLDEEALILESPHSGAHEGPEPRLAMFHAWVWPENPDGPFAQNNWALPWVRLGLVPPDRPDPVLARALSLAADGEAYYGHLLTRAAGLSDDPADATVAAHIVRSVDFAALEARAALKGRDRGDVLDPAAERALRDAWRELWESLRSGADDAAWERLRPAYEEWSGFRVHAGQGHSP